MADPCNKVRYVKTLKCATNAALPLIAQLQQRQHGRAVAVLGFAPPVLMVAGELITRAGSSVPNIVPARRIARQATTRAGLDDVEGDICEAFAQWVERRAQRAAPVVRVPVCANPSTNVTDRRRQASWQGVTMASPK